MLLAPMKNGEPIVVTTKRLRRVLFVAALAVAFSVTPAFAAPSSAPLDALSMQVQSSSSAILISGRLASTVTLPATLRIPIPSGATPYWVGEIIGTDPSKDPKATYTVQKANGYDLVVFTIKQGRTGQVEMSMPAPVVGAPSTLSYSLPIVSKVGKATLSFSLPVGSTLSTSTPGLVGGVGASGEPLFTKTVQNPKIGSVIKESLSYSAAGVTGGTASGSAVSGGSAADALAVPLWILVLIFAGLFAKAALGKRRAAIAGDLAASGDDAVESAFDDDSPSRAKATKASPAKRTAATAASTSTKRRTTPAPHTRRPQDA